LANYSKRPFLVVNGEAKISFMNFKGKTKNIDKEKSLSLGIAPFLLGNFSEKRMRKTSPG